MKRYITSFLLSNLFNILATEILCGIALFVILIFQHPQVGMDRTAINVYVHSNILIIWTLSGVGALVSVASGYLGAWIAKRKLLLFGALSATGCCVEALYSIFFISFPVWGIVALFLNLLFGIIGGYLYLRLKNDCS